jgi:putative endonuclease
VSIPPSRIDVGRTGEAATLAHYRGAGYRLIARNWRCKLGEIDLVFTKRQLLVFCEVKARTGSALGGPFESVNWKKKRKLRTLAEAFIAASGLRPEEVRFDVASVTLEARGRPSIFVFESAF